MSDPLESEFSPGDTEEVDALLVEGGEGAVVSPAPASLMTPARAISPAVQAAAVAATSFVAGAAVVGLVSRRHSRALAQGASPRRRLVGRRRGGARARGVEVLQVVSTRSLLVDVHLLGAPGEGR